MSAAEGAAGEAPAGRQSLVARLFGAAPEAKWFAGGFLDEVPLERIAATVRHLTGEFGGLQLVSPAGSKFIASLERADVPVRIAVDNQGRVVTLFFETPIPRGGTLTGDLAAIQALPGRISFVLVTDGKVRLSHNPAMPLAAASAFKLAVLRALADAVAAGRLAWDQVVHLDPARRSVGSGSIHGWPATPVTVAALANWMISVSDNTATDALIRLVGRGPIEALSPRNRPFLTTAEMHKLKDRGNRALRAAWLAGGEADRRGVLDALASLPVPVEDDVAHADLDIEWFFTAEEICELLDAVGDLPAMQINPGLAVASDWRAVAYKGGSDTGILNYSTRVIGRDGTRHCLVATWNDGKAVATSRLAMPYRAMLRRLAGEMAAT